eukprot:CAMPEP_0198337834 /NCGR_PEP_ID=MMETSP1450-20131203/31445_1 /TAXON_ID=753684 ORGANISM="Madagascaria erythrocladiodes, Strain CCMP3234" /NCGR_SAMPLE_ID=MMETSP1450 /ASSEMBLY_ACC=CAM_ASM_001115 /LENGTH=579 /DNA_ID=CAMNT_0044042673 /DNA_START=77 /DNA_END=1816 /DNA_ORIENTATION=+
MATPAPGGPGAGDKAVAAVSEKGDLTWNEFKKYGVNDGPKIIFIVLWVVINLILIVERALYYSYRFDADRTDEVRSGLLRNPASITATLEIGAGIPVARAAASALKFNCALILFTVCRNFLSALRKTCCNKWLPLDKNIVFHRYIAWTIAFLVFAHMGAHYFNYYYIAYVGGLRDANELDRLLNGRIIPRGGVTVNDAAWPTPMRIAWTTIPGVTGHLLVYTMCLMYTSASLAIRRPFFEMFWYTHHLFIVFFVLLIMHGFPGVLEPPNFYMWFILPCIVYTAERVWRVLRGNEDTVLGMAIQHPSKVLELRMKKSTFQYCPGEYLMLNCPAISRHEWHPFTITSAPEEDFVSVHIRIVGDWTGALQKLFNPDNRMGVVAQDITTDADGRPILRVDGAFGAASEEVFDYKTVVLVGAGIGVTPFSSILKSVRYRLERAKATGIVDIPITKVYFYWISRDRSAFEWFSELLSALEKDNINNFLEIHTYLTGALKPNEIKHVMYGEDDGQDAITGLQSGTHFGRPNWPQIFDQLAVKHQGEEIGVFFCGPSVLSKVLYKNSRRITMNDNNGTKFKYNKENF